MDATLGSRSGARLRAAALVSIPLLYAAQRAILTSLGTGSAPLVIVDPKLIPIGAAVALTALALLQCGALAVLARTGTPLAGALAAGAALVAISFAQSTSFSTDPYSYVGYAALPTFADGYAPPSLDLGSDFNRVYAYEGRPLIACLYGPLWLAFDRFVLAGSHSVAESLLRLRAVNVAWWAILVSLFAAFPATRRAAPLVAANPAIASCFVADAHVDIGGVTMLVAAALMGARRWWIVAGLGVAAGLWKITLAPLVLCAVAPKPRLRVIATVAIVALLTVALSLAWGGKPYAHALLSAGGSNTAGGFKGAVHALLFVAAGAALVAALAGVARRWMTWLPMTVAANLFPWYSMWALPLALRAKNALRAFLISWPLVSVTVGTFSPAFGYVVLIALTAGSAIADVRSGRAAQSVGG